MESQAKLLMYCEWQERQRETQKDLDEAVRLLRCHQDALDDQAWPELSKETWSFLGRIVDDVGEDL